MTIFVYLLGMFYSFIASLRIPTLFLWTLVILALGNSLMKTEQGWGMYHYYVGAKYFSEVGYFDLYECTVTEAIPRRDLYTYDYRIDEPDCQSYFTLERYDQFQQDIQDSGFYPQALIDKGYNGTPTWTAIFGTLANWNIITTDNAHIIDIIALVSALFFCVYHIGWRKSAYIAIIILTYYGTLDRVWGHYAQWVWLALALSGVVLLEKRNSFGSILLGMSTSLAIFPVFLMLRYRTAKDWILFGVALMTMLSIGLMNGRNVFGYGEFIQNMRLHSSYVKQELITGNIGLHQTIVFTETNSITYLKCFISWQDTCQYSYDNTFNPVTYFVALPLLLTSPLGAVFGLLTLSSYYWLVQCVIPIWYPERWTRLLLFINAVMAFLLLTDWLAYRHWILYLYFVALGFKNVRSLVSLFVASIKPRLYPTLATRHVRH